MKEYMLYGHGGAYNHGAEASIKCDIDILREISPSCRIILSTHFPEWDRKFSISVDEMIGRNVDAHSAEEMYADTINRITPGMVCLSVGGDNYCYRNWQRYAMIHKTALSKGAKSILWSCSLEESMVDEEMLEVLRTHHLIAARESYTARILESYGLENVVLTADVAFLLKSEYTECPDGKYVVVNLSPLVIRRNPKVLAAYQELLDEILRKTDWKVALLPHVEAPMDNDWDALIQLTGESDRVVRIPTGLSAAQYKHIIANSEACVASRTHATIASWSSGIPTLAIGYSTKAEGIASDLGQGKYVMNIQNVDGPTLINQFFLMWEERKVICDTLAMTVPECMKRVIPQEVLTLLR